MLDTLFTNARIVDVFRLRTFSGWFGVRGDRFLFVEEGAPPAGLAAKQTVDLGGDFVAPGLIDAHMHIESSLLTPRRFAEADDVRAVVEDGPGGDLAVFPGQKAGDGLQGRGFARAIGSEQGGDAALGDIQGQPLQDQDHVVVDDFQVHDLQNVHAAFPCDCAW